MEPEKQPNKSAQLLYKPIGIVSSLIAGLVAGQIFKTVWKHAAPGDQDDAPKPLESEYTMREVLVAAAIQGAIFSFVKAVVRRGGARAYQKWTGDWPGN
jgi:hypothetical protein